MSHQSATTFALLAAVLAASCASTPTTLTPSASTATSPAPTDTPAPACPPPSSSPQFPDPSSLPADPAVLTSYLDRGGDLPSLLSFLRAANLLPLYPNSLEAAADDFDGDGRQDLALSVQDLNAPAGPRPPGVLLVWFCRIDRYFLGYQLQSEQVQGAPVILASRDLTGDGGSEIVVGRPVCGAHTCFLALSALTWDGQQLVDVFSGTSEDLPSPTVVIAMGEAGIGTIAVTSGGVQSAGAGPPRPRTRTWAWTPQTRTFLAGPDVLSAPVFRVHVVHDADAAFEAGDVEVAAILYERALSDAALQEWEVGPATPASLRAYVHYRLVLLALVHGGHAAAQEAFNTMVEATVGVPEAASYLSLAELLLEPKDPVNLAAACAPVRQYASENPSQLLDPLYYGYDNRVYTPADLCPFE